MDVDSIKTLTVNPGDVIVVELDFGMMPASAATRYIESSHERLKEHFPDNKVLILPMHKSRISVVNFADAPHSDSTHTDVEYKEVD